MQKNFRLYFVCLCALAFVFGGIGCANMIPPTGGPKDSLPPVLTMALPKDSTRNFTGNRITLTFDEFVDMQNIFENVLVSPTPANLPVFNNHLRTVSIKLKDTLEPNTTYSINFGNAIKDVNEGNVYKDFTYVFSTGRRLDADTLTGRVILAETGKIDTTLVAVLHRNHDDSAVAKERPRYIAKLDGKGNFRFRNLSAGTFSVYVIPNDFSHHYDATTKLFAFADKPVNVEENNTGLTLYAYALPRIDTIKRSTPAPKGKPTEKDKKLQFQSNLESGKQDVLSNLELTFNKRITAFDSTKITLADKDFKPLSYRITADTGKTRFTILHTWPMETDYNLVIEKTAFADTAGVTLLRNDTIKFATKRTADYGTVRLRFKNLDFAKNPVLQIVQNEKVVDSIPLAQREWSRKLFKPGEYEMRILYDSNKNGKWDPGSFFGLHRQPEIVIAIKDRLVIRSNWDNEKDITL